MTDAREIHVNLQSQEHLSRAFRILKSRIEQRCMEKVVTTEAGGHILLAIARDLSPEDFRIDQTGAAVRIAGGSPRGVLYGVGKFLRTSRYDQTFTPSPWRGTSAPRCPLRGMYFATHFHNWYHVAPQTEIVRYIEDIALWGVNAIMVTFPMIDLEGWNDPETDRAVAMVREYAKAAQDLGLLFAVCTNNTMFKKIPQQIRATPLPDPTRRRGNSGHPICPSHPEGHQYILANTRRLFEHLSDIGLDLVCFWPYDEGGCACEKCRPWGSNGYLRLSRDLTQLGREYFPELKTILSTWLFDTPPEGEWETLAEVLSNDPGWVDYILADSHEDFPRYPLEVGVPGDLPLLNFPEISMWGNWPWGGVGAHPLPSRCQRLWDQVKHLVRGGFPYSEGIYEDVTKAVVTQFYWDPDRSARITLEEYIAYEFSPEVTADVLAVIDLLEAAAGCVQAGTPADASQAERAGRLADAVHDHLPEWARQNWRWEILRLRAVLDRERFAGGGLETPAAKAALARLIEIYHCPAELDDPYHRRVRPPLQ